MASNGRSLDSYVSKVCDGVRNASTNRNNRLNRASFALGRFVGAGRLERQSAEAALLEAALDAGLPQREASATIRSGLDGGQQAPRGDSQGTEQQAAQTPAYSFAKRQASNTNRRTASKMSQLASELNVGVDALHALGFGFNDRGDPTWPEYDGKGRIVTIVSRCSDGVKRAAKHSTRGLVLPNGKLPESPTSAAPLLIAEGASDTAALRTMGLRAIGRFNSGGGSELLTELLEGHEGGVVVLADQGGEQGAERVATALARAGVSATWAPCPGAAKDARSWLSDKDLDLNCDDLCVEAGTIFVEELTPRSSAYNQVASMRLWRPFPMHTLPEPLQTFVEVAASANQCDPAMVALPVLCACASAIGLSRSVELKGGWCEPAVLWVAVIARSGESKSPALDAALSPIRQLQREAFNEHEERRALYEQDLAAWERRNSNKHRRTDDPRPTQPTCRRVVVGDTTVEALAPILNDNPRGVLLERDELSGWLTFDQYKSAHARGGEAAKWLEAWRAQHWIIDRKTGDDRTLYVHRAAVSVCGAIQPGMFRRAIGGYADGEHAENGLLARLLVAFPPPRRSRWSESSIDRRTLGAYEQTIRALAQLETVDDDDGRAKPVLLPLTQNAKRAWSRFYDDWHDQKADAGTDTEAAMLAKLVSYCARLALIFQLVRAVNGQADDSAIDECSVAAAVELVEWFADEARRLYSTPDETDEQREIRQLAEYIVSRGGEITARDLATRGPRAFRGKTEDARGALDRLVRAGLARWEHPGRRNGRPPGPTCVVSTELASETPRGPLSAEVSAASGLNGTSRPRKRSA